jgi:hypothetical protein
MNHVSTRQLLMTFVPAGLLLAVVGILGFGYGQDIGQLMREPTATAQLHPLTGAVSNLGILLWAASASIALFAGWVLRGTDRGDAPGFLISSACLSAYLCLDDFFQIHEDLIGRYVGIRERYVYVALAVAVLVYLVRYRRVIMATHYPMLIIAIGFLGASVAIDEVLEPWLERLGQGRIFIEDGSKWLGIAAWCSYYARTSFGLLSDALRAPPGRS